MEILQYIIVRPFTLAVRLFANMFAGHILLLVFTLATWYLLSLSIGLLFSATSFVLTVALTGVRDADPGAAGLYLHDPDRPVHRRVAGSGALRWPMSGTDGGARQPARTP